MSGEPLRAAVYCRKSSDDRQEEEDRQEKVKGRRKKGGVSLSVKNQTNECLAVIKREGWTLVKDETDGAFYDDGISGRTYPTGKHYDVAADADYVTKDYIAKMGKKRRPGLGRLLDRVRRREIDVIIVRDMPRLARPVFQSDFQNFLPNYLKKYGVSVFSIADGMIDYNDFSRMIVRFMSDAMLDQEIKNPRKTCR